MIKIGDYVKIPLPKDSVVDITKYAYGEVIGIDKYDFLDIYLREPVDGAKCMISPGYLAQKLTNAAYAALDNVMPHWGRQHWTSPPIIKTNMECDHDWIKTGCSPITGQFWYDCKNCQMKKENV